MKSTYVNPAEMDTNFTGNRLEYIEAINYALDNKLGIVNGGDVKHIGDNQYEFDLVHRGGCDGFRKCLIYKSGGELKHKIKATGDWMCID